MPLANDDTSNTQCLTFALSANIYQISAIQATKAWHMAMLYTSYIFKVNVYFQLFLVVGLSPPSWLSFRTTRKFDYVFLEINFPKQYPSKVPYGLCIR